MGGTQRILFSKGSYLTLSFYSSQTLELFCCEGPVGQGIKFPFDQCEIVNMNPGRSKVMIFLQVPLSKKFPSVINKTHPFKSKHFCNKKSQQSVDVPPFQTIPPIHIALFWYRAKVSVHAEMLIHQFTFFTTQSTQHLTKQHRAVRG